MYAWEEMGLILHTMGTQGMKIPISWYWRKVKYCIGKPGYCRNFPSGKSFSANCLMLSFGIKFYRAYIYYWIQPNFHVNFVFFFFYIFTPMGGLGLTYSSRWGRCLFGIYTIPILVIIIQYKASNGSIWLYSIEWPQWQ